MAWEISHSPEAFENARTNLESWNRRDLIMALCDDKFEEIYDEHNFEHADKISNDLREELSSEFVSHDALVDACMEAIERNGTCDNGGHFFWIDREGYHKVSCSVEK